MRTYGLLYHKEVGDSSVYFIHLIQKRLLWALAIGHWETIVWRSLKRSNSLFSYAQMPKAQLPMTSCQSNFY
ncbi:MAG: hypothetical protein OIF50_17840, partial [Flavobacteriaceae bacterium]|nr:hypothetical protein [Flavobacteriaceae bacterium]